MNRDSGAGREPVPPAMLAMAILLQAYEGMSDAEAVEMTVVDLRWQMVLDRLGSEDPAFSQGTLAFRERLIRNDMDRRLLERTIELARATKAFDFKKLPKTLRVAIDSSPLEGAGRVEDTINLLVTRGARTGAADELVTMATFARQRSISEPTVRAAIRAGRLPAVKIGRAVRVRADALIGDPAPNPNASTNANTPQAKSRSNPGGKP